LKLCSNVFVIPALPPCIHPATPHSKKILVVSQFTILHSQFCCFRGPLYLGLKPTFYAASHPVAWMYVFDKKKTYKYVKNFCEVANQVGFWLVTAHKKSPRFLVGFFV